LIGSPVTVIVSILASAAPEFGKQFGMKEIPDAGIALAVFYIGVSTCEIFITLISQWLKSRKKTIYISLFVQFAGVLWFLYFPPQTLFGFYARCAVIGSSYFPILLTTVSEQFGTNMRATATVSAPNFIRAVFIPLSFIFQQIKPALGLVNSAALVIVCAILISSTAMFFTKETFGKNLDFYEI